MNDFDREDESVAWGMVGGVLLCVLNLEVLKENPKVNQEDLFKALSIYAATGAIGGLIGGLALAEAAGPGLAGIMGGIAGSWFLIVAGRNF